MTTPTPTPKKSNTKEAVDDVVEATEATGELTPDPEQHSSDKISVTNITKRTLNLVNGQIKPGENGMATRAELGTLFDMLEVN